MKIYVITHYGFDNDKYFSEIHFLTKSKKDAEDKLAQVFKEVNEQYHKDLDPELTEDDIFFDFINMFGDSIEEKDTSITRRSIDGAYVDTYKLVEWG
ncbi:MAG: hypothetical protein ACR2M6_02615 [Vampirovibrionia bacterium]